MSTNLFQRANNFYLKGNIKKAEDCCLKAIANDAGDYRAYNLLGVMAIKNKQFGHSVHYLKQAIQINPDYAEGYINLGALYKENALFDEALACFNKAFLLKPEFAETNYNLGCILQSKKKYDEAIHYYKESLKYKPNFAEAYNNIGHVLHTKGLSIEAVDFCKKALEINPDLVEAHVNIVRSMLSTSEEDYWGKYITDCVSAPFEAFQKAELLNYLAIYWWLQGQPEKSMDLLEQVNKFITTLTDTSSYKQMIAYNIFVRSLCGWYKNDKGSCFTSEKHNETLYFIGESHSLTCANKSFSVNDKIYKCKTYFMMGCKIWHLINGEDTRYRKYKISLDRKIDLLPKGATVVFTVGEIDCRRNEGIFTAYTDKKIDWKDNTDNLINQYFEKIILPVKGRELAPFVWGVPFIHQKELKKIDLRYQKDYSDFIVYFNKRLEKTAIKHDVGYVDNFSLTFPGCFAGDSDAHIDGIHLRPDIYIQAVKSAVQKCHSR